MTILTVHDWLHAGSPNLTEAQRQKILGCLYGGAAGDALGYPVEFLSLDRIRKTYGEQGLRFYAPTEEGVVFSDDTQMTLFTLEGLMLWREALRNDPAAKLKNAMFRAYRDWYFTQLPTNARKAAHKARTKLYSLPMLHNAYAPGITCMRALRKKKAGSMDDPDNESKGNGGVMRVAPIGFSLPRTHWTLKQVILLGAESAAITHGHPLGFLAAGFMAGLINECVFGSSAALEDAVCLALEKTAEVFANADHLPELTELVDKALVLAAYTGKPEDEVIPLLGRGEVAESAAALAVYCTLRHEHDFDSAIAAAVNLNGDSDTVAAIAGNLWGAWNGLEGVHEKWLTPLQLDPCLQLLDQEP